MNLELQTRRLGETLVIHCSGRIVAGQESRSLQDEVLKHLQEPNHFVLHLGEVSFLDSSGLGALVRLLASTRTARRNLCLCCVPDLVRKTLTITNVLPLFPAYETEVEAVQAAHMLTPSGERRAEWTRPPVLCLESSSEIRAYLSEVLRQAEFLPMVCANLHDAVTLQKAIRAKTIILGSEKASAYPRPARETLSQIEPAARFIELDPDFSRQHAGDATQNLLASLKAA